MVNRRLIIFLLAATLGASQSGLVYAASASAASKTAVYEVQMPGLPAGSETACLRGGQACGGYGSEGCCAEMAAAGAVAGAVGAWLAAGIAAYYYAAYC